MGQPGGGLDCHTQAAMPRAHPPGPGFPPQPHRTYVSAMETTWACPVAPADGACGGRVTQALPLESFREVLERAFHVSLSVGAAWPCFAPVDLRSRGNRSAERRTHAGGGEGHRQHWHLPPGPHVHLRSHHFCSPGPVRHPGPRKMFTLLKVD